MVKVTSVEFQRKFGQYQDMALSDPVIITRNGRERIVMLAIDEYKRLIKRDRQVLKVGQLSDAELDAIGKAAVPEKYKHLDTELD